MDYLTTKEAAEELGLSWGRVKQLVARLQLPATKKGGVNLISRTDLDEFKEKDRPAGRPKTK